MLDGFTITAGNANGDGPDPDQRNGGGIFSYYGSATLMNLIVGANAAALHGGGMNAAAGSPTLTDVTFSGNVAGGGLGGGMYDVGGSFPVLTNVTFDGNTAVYGGGMAQQRQQRLPAGT